MRVLDMIKPPVQRLWAYSVGDVGLTVAVELPGSDVVSGEV